MSDSLFRTCAGAMMTFLVVRPRTQTGPRRGRRFLFYRAW